MLAKTANLRLRILVRVLEITPKLLPEAMFVFGLAHAGWVGRLNASKRNCTFCRPVKANSLCAEKSSANDARRIQQLHGSVLRLLEIPCVGGWVWPLLVEKLGRRERSTQWQRHESAFYPSGS